MLPIFGHFRYNHEANKCMLALALSCTPRGGPLNARPLIYGAFDLFTAARTYSSLPHTRVSSSLPLGTGEDSSSVQGNGSTLKTTGGGRFNWSNTRSRQKLLLSLRAYKDFKGDLLVPQAFIVPSGDSHWPQETWGHRLGKAVGSLRNKLKKADCALPLELEELGLTLDVLQYRWDNIILPALRKFYEVHGHTDVPGSWVVPSGDEAWPEKAWGWNLGFSVNAIRSYNTYPVQVTEALEELEKMDFCFTTIAERDWSERILPSLQVFRQEFGHCIVDLQFKVPSSSPWPTEAWGMALGPVVNSIRGGRNYTEQSVRDKDILDKLDFAWDFYEDMWNKRIISALDAFVAEYGHCEVAQKFVIPETEPWPKHVWGMALGVTMRDMRCNATFLAYSGRDVSRLQALGYRFKLSKGAWKKRVVPLIERYSARFGHKHIPADFVVPPEAGWPKAMWGVELGYIVARNSDHVLEQSEKQTAGAIVEGSLGVPRPRLILLVIDLKFLICLVLIIAGIWTAHFVLLECWTVKQGKKNTRNSTEFIFAPTPVPYSAGMLWPVVSVSAYWTSDYFCIRENRNQSWQKLLHQVQRKNVQVRNKHSDQVNPFRFSLKSQRVVIDDQRGQARKYRYDSSSGSLQAPQVSNVNPLRFIQHRMKCLHRRGDDVEANVAFMNAVVMSDPLVFLRTKFAENTTTKLAYYQSILCPRQVVLLPIAVVGEHNEYSENLKLLRRVNAAELTWSELVQRG